ncbi:Ser-rich protein [Cotesia vestalis bracovirus]|nr:Ser-rich protein [Cotesia vestalis bracovirus]
MADRKQTTYKKTSEKDMPSLVRAFQMLSPAKRQYVELSKSDSTSSMSSASSYVSNSSVSITPMQKSSSSSSKYQSASSQPGTSGMKNKETKKEKELLQKLEKNVKDTSKTLNEYVAIRNPPSIGHNNSLSLKNRRNYSKSLIFQFATLPSGLYENPKHLVLTFTRRVIHVEINKLTTIIKDSGTKQEPGAKWTALKMS